MTAASLTIILVLFMAINAVSASANQTVFLPGSYVYTLNGQQEEMDAVTFLENNRMFIPVRFLAYTCGLSDEGITWDEVSQTVTLKGENQMLSLQVGSNRLVNEDGLVEMDVVPQLIGGRIYLPARWVAQQFNYTVEWDESNNVTLVFPPGGDKPQVIKSQLPQTKHILLVNKSHGLPDDFDPGPLVDFGTYQVSALLQQPLLRLYEAAAQQGIHITMTSAYRSYEKQRAIFDEQAKLYSMFVAEATVAPPGHSEHQTGLAVDIVGDDAAYRWLEKNGPRFGFILRYPRGKESITGYAYESWHYRYVGVPVATFMREKSILTLEEYLNIYVGQTNGRSI